LQVAILIGQDYLGPTFFLPALVCVALFVLEDYPNWRSTFYSGVMNPRMIITRLWPEQMKNP
jgi:hypothetical protein